MNRTLTVGLSLSLFGPPCHAAELQPETLNAWEAYLRTATSEMNARLDPSRHFLWVDEQPDGAKRVQNGEILASPKSGNGQFDVPHGIIHHWMAVAFIPKVTLQQVFDVVNDYDRYKIYYKPPVVESKQISSKADSAKFSLRLMKKTFLMTAILDMETETRYFRRNATQSYSFGRSTRITEIEKSKSTERALPAGTGSGYVWRVANINRFVERDGGVYLELEAMALSRDIPASAGWLVKPLISRVSRSAVITALEQTRAAVRSNGAGTSGLASTVR